MSCPGEAIRPTAANRVDAALGGTGAVPSAVLDARRAKIANRLAFARAAEAKTS